MGINKGYVTLDKIINVYIEEQNIHNVFNYFKNIDIINTEDNELVDNIVDCYYDNDAKKATEIINFYIYNK